MGGGGAGEAALQLRGGARPKRVGGRRSDWTAAKSDKFIETLADTCNVTLAAASIGRSIANVYKRRGKDASFRGEWGRALAVGYSRPEMMLLERALHGVEKDRDGERPDVVGDARTIPIGSP